MRGCRLCHGSSVYRREKQSWPLVLQAAALPLGVTVVDYHMPRPAETLKPHDPRHFERILRLPNAAITPLPE